MGRALKSSTGSLMRCTVLDEKGHTKIANGEFKRSELLSKHGLLPRDLRKVDVSTHNIVPAILVRENSILIHLLHIRALVKSDSVLLFDIYGHTDSKAHSMFLYDLEHRLRNQSGSELPYELRALEAILVSVTQSLDSELQVHTHLVNGLLADLEQNIARDQLRRLLLQSKQMSSFLQKATLIRDALADLLDNEEDMQDLCLTAKSQDQQLPGDTKTSDAEIMLESYYNYCDEIVQATETLASNIKSTEEIINIVLDANRNSLMTLELKFQIGMLGLSAGSMVAAVYGMNLKNFIEDSNWGFVSVVGVIGAITVAIIVTFLRRLHRLQRLQMGKMRRREKL